MRYLALALWAEGPSDQRFLRPVIRRAVHDITLRFATQKIEIAEEFVPLTALVGEQELPRAERIAAAVAREIGGVTIIFIHADGAGDPDATLAERIAPARDRIALLPVASRPTVVGVVPVREAEAWALADAEALRATLGAARLRPDAVPSSPRDVERIADPKAHLATVVEEVVGRRGRRRGATGWLAELGERVRLAQLRQVPAFARFERDLCDCLADLRCIGPATQP